MIRHKNYGEEMLQSKELSFTSGEDLKSCNIFIITVPTPIDSNKKPDLTPLIKAAKLWEVF